MSRRFNTNHASPPPDSRPRSPWFSSGPCTKPSGNHHPIKSWLAKTGGFRAHRSPEIRRRIREVSQAMKELAGVPANWLAAIVPGSGTGAAECMVCNLLGNRSADVFIFDRFADHWLQTTRARIGWERAREIRAAQGELPDFSVARQDRDIVFVYNGTTTGLCVGDLSWIPLKREGLVLCDASSAMFMNQFDYTRLDAISFSWQKALGGEAGLGTVFLSPRAQEALAARPASIADSLPRVLRLPGRIDESHLLNTPSLYTIADFSGALSWGKRIGGLPMLIARTNANASVLYQWADQRSWLQPNANTTGSRSMSSPVFRFLNSDGTPLENSLASDRMKTISERLETLGVAYDICTHHQTPPGLRIWCGPTIETEDLTSLTKWLDWANSDLEIS